MVSFLSSKMLVASSSLRASIMMRPIISNRFVLGNAVKFMSSAPKREYLLLDYRGANNCVAVITLNRPKALNALSDPLMQELNCTIAEAEAQPNVAAIVITGSEKAFAAGADIKQMQTRNFVQVYKDNFLSGWDRVSSSPRVVIAAVNGYALGGGCELAMMADIILAGEKAKFGQPEINLGTIPGAGGTQRLVRAIGKSRAMQLCLTGEMINAKQACDWGLVSAVYPPDQLVDEAVKLGEKIASKSKVALQICKEAINKSYDLSLTEGLRVEKQLFYSTFATNDRKEGMTAFVEKREPRFTDS
ncbi:enoyl-CoA hydratase, mitochondrial [Hyalella azteca]|uniref:Probable enoyl-CoA hydratase, mitochondrial n=1 Tax=Hyalella azteca TaxID=294128 RepID=A0A8B7PDJ3_HYAAZ|nr:enoyl-CoA hydratase, mitochondrial [Hyalella azteca]